MTPTRLLVIESYNKTDFNNHSIEWGLSFDGHNPESENYFPMIDENTAFRLKEKLSAMYPPVTFDNPIRRPTDKL